MLTNQGFLENLEAVILGTGAPSDELIAWLKKMEGAVYRQGGKMDGCDILWSIRYFLENNPTDRPSTLPPETYSDLDTRMTNAYLQNEHIGEEIRCYPGRCRGELYLKQTIQ